MASNTHLLLVIFLPLIGALRHSLYPGDPFIMPPRNYVLHETNLRLLRRDPPRVAVLPWGATEAHNLHLPYGTDTIEATELAERGAALACQRGAKVVVLPAIPFGNDEQQLDQVATISITTATALALLDDIARSLSTQGIDRLVIVNAHGGNEFQPLVRDIQQRRTMLIAVVRFAFLAPQALRELFEKEGDHADEMETSVMLHLRPDWVDLAQASSGTRLPWKLTSLQQPGVWTPRPWSQTHPDTGAGDPRLATAEKGRIFLEQLTEALANVLVELSDARPGDLPYLGRDSAPQENHLDRPCAME